jgi:hypothetical protein
MQAVAIRPANRRPANRRACLMPVESVAMPDLSVSAPEAAFRGLRAAVNRGDGEAALAATDPCVRGAFPQYAGDGILIALAQGVDGAIAEATRSIATLRARDLGGDVQLADEIEAALGLAPASVLRALSVDLDDLSMALEGDPMLTGGRIDLRTGEVQQAGPLFESDAFAEEFDDQQDELGDQQDELGDVEERAEADERRADERRAGGERWLHFDSLGSRPGYGDMVEFLSTVDDEALAGRLERALGGRGAFRRFKDSLAEAPDQLERFFRFSDDRSRGRARRWMAESGLRPAVPTQRARA